MVPSLRWMETGTRRLLACFPSRCFFPCPGDAHHLGWVRLLRPSPGSLHRWGQHRAPAPASPTVHHAPGGTGCGRRGRRHQLCIRSPPRLLQLLGQLHEPGGVLQPHEPRQQRPVSPGRWPRWTCVQETTGSWVPSEHYSGKWRCSFHLPGPYSGILRPGFVFCKLQVCLTPQADMETRFVVATRNTL